MVRRHVAIRRGAEQSIQDLRGSTTPYKTEIQLATYQGWHFVRIPGCELFNPSYLMRGSNSKDTLPTIYQVPILCHKSNTCVIPGWSYSGHTARRLHFFHLSTASQPPCPPGTPLFFHRNQPGVACGGSKP